jgi:hypothetical protein
VLNLLRQEARHHRRCIPLETVEHSSDAGKYLVRENEPSLRLCVAEGRDAAQDPAVAAVLASAMPQERRVLELMLEGERRAAVIASEIGLGDRPPAEQEATVQRLKNRVDARLRQERRQT